MEEKKWCVYKHTSPNGKCYIGITCQERPQDRWHSDGGGYKSQRKFYRAIEKYGWENFSHEILVDDIKSLEDAYIEEKKYIKLFDSHRNGYNCSNGGDGCLGYKRSEESLNRIVKKHHKPTYQYALSGEFIQGYKSRKEASEKTGVHINSIIACLEGKYKYAGDYQWKNYKTKKIKPCHQFKAVNQIEKGTNIIINTYYCTIKILHTKRMQYIFLSYISNNSMSNMTFNIFNIRQ